MRSLKCSNWKYHGCFSWPWKYSKIYFNTQWGESLKISLRAMAVIVWLSLLFHRCYCTLAAWWLNGIFDAFELQFPFQWKLTQSILLLPWARTSKQHVLRFFHFSKISFHWLIITVNHRVTQISDIVIKRCSYIYHTIADRPSAASEYREITYTRICLVQGKSGLHRTSNDSVPSRRNICAIATDRPAAAIYRIREMPYSDIYRQMAKK